MFAGIFSCTPSFSPEINKVYLILSYLICGNCASWVQHESSGCDKKLADTRGDGFVFTCKGCPGVAALVKEVEGVRQMVEDMKEMVAGLRFQDKGAETESSATTTGV